MKSPGAEWLNYHHLLYFWTAVQEGGVTQAARRLHVAQPTVTGQIRALERRIGERLFERKGRKLGLTETGRLVHQHAQEIFAAGEDLVQILTGRSEPGARRLVVGVADALPKLIAHRILAPVLGLNEPVRIVAREGAPERLLQDLVAHDLDVVLADEPVRVPSGVRAFHHLLGDCGVTFFGAPSLVRSLGPRPRFPGLLDGAPVLLPGEGSALRRSLDGFFARAAVQPRVVGEFDDIALLMAFGQAGTGFFAAPSAIDDAVIAQHGVKVLGRAGDVRERFYAISVERRLRHPAVVAISEAARRGLFAS